MMMCLQQQKNPRCKQSNNYYTQLFKNKTANGGETKKKSTRPTDDDDEAHCVWKEPETILLKAST